MLKLVQKLRELKKVVSNCGKPKEIEMYPIYMSLTKWNTL